MHVPTAHNNSQLLVSTLDGDTCEESISVIFDDRFTSHFLIYIEFVMMKTCAYALIDIQKQKYDMGNIIP